MKRKKKKKLLIKIIDKAFVLNRNRKMSLKVKIDLQKRPINPNPTFETCKRCVEIDIKTPSQNHFLAFPPFIFMCQTLEESRFY